MKYVKQFVIILGFSLAGEVLNYILPLPVPAGIYGIILLFCCLEFHIVPASAVEDTGLFLVEIMPVMFIPAAAGLIDSWDIIRSSWLSYLVIVAVSTVAVMAVSGLVTQAVIRIKEKWGREEKSHE
ncbi:MAG: CidA/LrgA family protein [Clostridiales bacterium]|nr:CidA/LrgA family protein [Clostridiales bacterium]